MTPFHFQLSRDKDVLKTVHGILLKSLTQSDAGLYHCLATENNFKHTVARISLRILDREIVEALTESDVLIEPEHRRHHSHHHPPPPPPPPQTNPPALQLHPQPEVRLINQYCQSYRQQIQSKPHKAKRNNRRHTGEQEEEELQEQWMEQHLGPCWPCPVHVPHHYVLPLGKLGPFNKMIN